MRTLSEEKLQELKRLNDWCLEILIYIVQITPTNTPAYHEEFKSIVEFAFQKQDLRGMRMLAGDLSEWGRGLSKNQREELNLVLMQKFGENLNYNLKKVQKILTRGKIKNKQEYILLFSYLENIFSDGAEQEELDKANKLLEDYQELTGKI